jgi:PPK2 family polyphosphate:nucleotide phosphotransferase
MEGHAMFIRKFMVEPGQKVQLSKWDSGCVAGYKGKNQVQDLLARNQKRLDKLQYLLFADNAQAVLIVLQGLDGSGKDGTIRHVMSGLNPQGCQVTAFKKPSEDELEHDFLWRIHKAVPRRGMIGIFNRSHYEDVLIVRVHKLVPKSVWSHRYDQINQFEKYLADNGIKIIKLFLHISKGEQKVRFKARLEDKDKNWKLSPDDLAERDRWNDYIDAYEDALTRCSTPWAPWYIIPADHKWFRNLAVSDIIVETIEKMDLKIPPPMFDLSKVVIR